MCCFIDQFRSFKERIDYNMGLSHSYYRLETVLDEIPAPASQTPVMDEIDDHLKVVESPCV